MQVYETVAEKQHFFETVAIHVLGFSKCEFLPMGFRQSGTLIHRAKFCCDMLNHCRYKTDYGPDALRVTESTLSKR